MKQYLIVVGLLAVSCTEEPTPYSGPGNTAGDAGADDSTPPGTDGGSTGPSEDGGAESAEGDSGGDDGSQDSGSADAGDEESSDAGDGEDSGNDDGSGSGSEDDGGDSDAGDESSDGDETGDDGSEDSGGTGDSGADSSGSSDDGGDPPPDYDDDVQPIWDQYCLECHGSMNPDEELDLSQGGGAIVGVAAAQLSSMSLIEAGSVDQSYLWHKLVGDQASVGGSGEQMPEDEPPLGPAEMAIIQAWIEAGAPY